MRRISDRAAYRPIHLNPQAELAERALLPGDPQRALLIAQAVLDAPRMFNTRRGLWGYTGRAADGALITVQSTGMGGPSAAIVMEELIGLGARTFIRVGTCGALDPGLSLGDMVVADRALATDGTSRALGAGERAHADAGLTAALVADGARTVTAVSTDVFYDTEPGRPASLERAGADVIEMEAATIFTVADRHGVAAACLLGVTDLLGGSRTRLDDDGLEALGLRLGEAGAAALARQSQA